MVGTPKGDLLDKAVYWIKKTGDKRIRVIISGNICKAAALPALPLITSLIWKDMEPKYAKWPTVLCWCDWAWRLLVVWLFWRLIKGGCWWSGRANFCCFLISQFKIWISDQAFKLWPPWPINIFIYRKVTSSRPVYYSILELIAQILQYSHLSNKSGGWNKRGGGSNVAKSENMEVWILQLESSPFVFK